jgi:hypothetical protein
METQLELNEAIALLSRTPRVLDAMLRGQLDSWTRTTEGPDTWSAHTIVGHLIHGEREDWIPRLHRILSKGETRGFDPFDREAQFRDRQMRTVDQLLDEFAQLRAENLAELQRLELKEADFERRGKHPAFGVVTLSQLLATWTVHDLTHLHQLSRVLARRYEQAVGPWKAYLGVLHCDAHSG